MIVKIKIMNYIIIFKLIKYFKETNVIKKFQLYIQF